MVVVRVKHTCPTTKAVTYAKVTAPDIASALRRFGGQIQFPLDAEEYFSGEGKDADVEITGREEVS